MIDKRNNFILLWILNQTQQDSADARDGMNTSVATISFEQVFYIFFSDAVFISNNLYFRLYFDKFLE